MAGRKAVNQSKVTVVGFGTFSIMRNMWYLRLKCVGHKNQPIRSFIRAYPRVEMQPLHKILSLSSCLGGHGGCRLSAAGGRGEEIQYEDL